MQDSKTKIVDSLCSALEPLFPAPVQGIGADGNTESAPRVPRATRDHLIAAVHGIWTACGGKSDPKQPNRPPICDPKSATAADLKPLFPVGPDAKPRPDPKAVPAAKLDPKPGPDFSVGPYEHTQPSESNLDLPRKPDQKPLPKPKPDQKPLPEPNPKSEPWPKTDQKKSYWKDR